MATARKARRDRVIGITRVSRTKDDGKSPKHQRERLVDDCERTGRDLIDVIEELDVSGGTPLAKRKGLLRAVEMVEAGEADIIEVAYFDRLVRSLKVQEQILDRVEAAGGKVYTLDFGRVSNGTASEWLQATQVGMMNEYYRRQIGEKTEDAKRDAVARGVAPFAHVPHGIRKRESDRVLEPDTEVAPIIREAFELRASGATIDEVRSFLAGHGLDVSYHSTQSMLASRLYLGQLRWGGHVNDHVFPPIIDAALWRRVQDMRVLQGRKAKSERLLARLGILRCGTCGSRLVVNNAGGNRGATSYRCGAKNDCPDRVQIGADLAEAEVVRVTKELLAERHGEASADDRLVEAERALSDAEQTRDTTVENLAGVRGDVARQALQNAQKAVDDAADRLAELQSAIPINRKLVVSVEDWDLFTIAEQRRLIALVIERVDVAKGGTGPARMSFTPRKALA